MKKVIYFFMIILIACFISIINYTSKDIQYKNSDATWHTLLTIKAYSQTPVSVHKFVPIVTLGDINNKHIAWGAAVSDKFGNYYYTSFSPAGFFVPYIFIKCLNLPVNENSLYLLNSIILLLSVIILGVFVIDVFSKSRYKYIIGICSALLYATSFEIMHGQGHVWWNHSLMQITLLTQIYAFYKFKTNKIFKILFYTLCVINPYIEWTGFVANFGFILAYYLDKKICLKQKLSFIIMVISFSFLSALILTLHFASVIPFDKFIKTSLMRAHSRSDSFSLNFYQLLYNYIISYTSLIIILLFNLIIIKTNNISIKINSIVCKDYKLLLILGFPLIENLIMMNHATWYSFDTMKLSYILVFVNADLLNIIFLNIKTIKKYLLCLPLIFFVVIGNIFLYRYSTSCDYNFYVYDIQYEKQNETFANYIKKRFNNDNSVIGTPSDVRGYKVLLFDRNIHEFTTLDELINENKNKRYVIYFFDRFETVGIQEIDSGIIYDKDENTYKFIKATQDNISEINISKKNAHVIAGDLIIFNKR